MKKVLISIPWFFPAFKAGGPIQSILNLVSSNQKNICYYIFTSDHDVDGTAIEVSKKNKWIPFNEHTYVWYNDTRFAFSNLNKEIKLLNSNFIFINGIYSLHYSILPLLFLSISQKILSVRGMLHPGALSQKPYKKKLFLSFLKLCNIQKRISFHATDKIEEQIIHSIFGNNASVFVAANYPKKIIDAIPKEKKSNTLHLITVALISPMKNHLLVLQSLQNLPHKINYTIIGAIKDIAYWDECLDVISKLPPNIKVNYVGEKSPELISNYLSQADVFIMPSKSENYGHAIIEALQSGLPVITSNKTPWNRLFKNNAGYNTDLSVKSISETISFFCNMDAATLNKWSNGAISYAKESINLDEINTQYALMFNIKN